MGDKDKYRNLKDLAYYSSLGISLALAIFIGLFLGVWLDNTFDTSPILTLIGLGMGIVAGFRNLIRAGKKSRKM
jgi:ATP synthase protein I